jgi:Ni/Fe-hydrogenase subunit HybB-like protein
LALAAFVASFTVAGLIYLVATGVGVWGHANPVNWAWDIVNFVFWIGIGHAGTLISAILCLLRQKWRTSINRPAEAMTIFAVVCAAIFPVFHVGRIWFAVTPGWLFPFPNSNGIWQNFRSPLEWDVFAVSTYGTVSVLFWYVGLIPDLGTLRDRFTAAGNLFKARLYGFFAMGWRGSNRHWSNYEMAYLILAGISTPLVLSVHTIVSFDFAVSLIPGWHTTIFPPYFVAGAIFSGFGMVLTLMLPLRAVYRLEDLITQYHIDCMCKIILATGTMVGYAYSMEFFIAWYGANPYEGFAFINRAFGHYAWAYWIMISCNVITPQFFWFKAVREQHHAGLDPLDLRQRRHVVRALRDHRHLAGPRLPAVELGLLFARRSWKSSRSSAPSASSRSCSSCSSGSSPSCRWRRSRWSPRRPIPTRITKH